MTSDFRIVALISGRGSNLKSLIRERKSFEIMEVLSNKPSPPGFRIAAEAGIPTWGTCHRAFPILAERKQAIYRRINYLRPDLIVLAGFMLILEPDFIAQYPAKIVNIHPSLLPQYPGLETHRRALEVFRSDPRMNRHGCSVHLVDSGVDTGQVIAQSLCQIEPEDDENTLASKVLAQEHRLYPFVVNAIASGGIRISELGIRYSSRTQRAAAQLGFSLSLQDQ